MVRKASTQDQGLLVFSATLSRSAAARSALAAKIAALDAEQDELLDRFGAT